MAKIIIILILSLFFNLSASILEKNCLNCHKKEQIPNYLIYKRYLLKYSSQKRIKKAIFLYLKNPKQKNSIMPKPFFLKFPMKKAINLTDKELKQSINAFVEKFDVKKRLILPKIHP